LTKSLRQHDETACSRACRSRRARLATHVCPGRAKGGQALTKEDALDLQDFTVALLERVFTEPERLKLAEERRAQRRAQIAGAKSAAE
jgi:hypothetical protein